MKLSGIFRQLMYLKNTVRSVYGAGAKAWFSFIYYGLFRLNRFRILKVNLEMLPATRLDVPGVSFVSPGLDELESLRAPHLPREFFCDRFHKVSNCCIARLNGALAYIHWIYFCGDFSRFLSFGEDCAEINYVLTLPEYRGHGISAAAFCHSLHSLRDQGIRNVFAVVHEENIASLKSFGKAGFVDVGSTFSFGLFNRKVSV
ncbi:MAG: GNAT family N-acetyltransferase [Geobacteraceae bacterium]|nr:GNAT family N-acetyltransferase [Geobacteraceae bacterium]